MFEDLGDRSGAAWSINQQGDIAREQHNLVRARELYQQALSAFRKAGDRWGSARSLTDLGSIECEQGNFPGAQAAYHEAIEIFADLGHRRGIARILESSAGVAQAQGNAARALKLGGAAAHLRRLISAPLPQAEQSKLDQMLTPAWESLGEKNGTDVWVEGSGMSMDEAIRFSLEVPE